MNGIAASTSGMVTAGQGLAVAANNVANVNTAGYQAKRLDQETQSQGGVRASGLTASQAPTTPGGSNVDLATEAISAQTDSFSYQANLKFLSVQNDILGSTLDMKA